MVMSVVVVLELVPLFIDAKEFPVKREEITINL